MNIMQCRCPLDECTRVRLRNVNECAQAAAQRKMDFEVGVYMDPIFFGQFPDSVRARLPYLPKITPELVSTNAHIID